jgi:hypothetical protein
VDNGLDFKDPAATATTAGIHPTACAATDHEEFKFTDAASDREVSRIEELVPFPSAVGARRIAARGCDQPSLSRTTTEGTRRPVGNFCTREEMWTEARH